MALPRSSDHCPLLQEFDMKIKDFQDRAHYLGAAAMLVFTGAAQAAPSPSAGPPAKNPAVTLEPMPGTNAKRVILAPKAAERLGIATSPVQEQPITRRQMVGGLVIAALDSPPDAKPGGGFGGFAPAAREPGTGAAGFAQRTSASGPAGGGFTIQAAAERQDRPSAAPGSQPPVIKPIPGTAWVSVTLTPAEWDRVAKDKPVRLLPLSTREALKKEVLAQPMALPPREDVRRSMLTVYYGLPGNDHGLTLNQRMRVELQLAGSDERYRVVPYSAIYYDAKGAAWVYVNPKPYVYERQLVQVERVAGDVAAISEGPPVGTQVVSTGAAMLFGAEIFGK
jgi:hypothetical protein